MKLLGSRRYAATKIGASALGVAALLGALGATQASARPGHGVPVRLARATTPIKHIVIIYGENVSFDHYFGTYPYAANTAGEPAFKGAPGTPQVNGLYPDKANGNVNLLTSNPNLADPQRLDPGTADSNIADILTCDQNHGYKAEQSAFDGGKMDKFIQDVATGTGKSPEGQPCNADTDMDYYDGNTVTALWNYAQHFAMDDNSFSTVFGPSTPGAVDVVSGDTGNVTKVVGNGILGDSSANSAVVSDGDGEFSDISDTAPYYDDCPDYSNASLALSGENVGDQLNAAGLSWGWFEGGFDPTTPSSVTGSDPGYVSPTVTGGYESGETPAVCGSTHDVGAAIGGTGQYGTKSDYIAHHEPFQYYASTANPHHTVETDLAKVGTDTQSYTKSGQPEFNTANHQYDTSTFNDLLTAIDQGKLSPSHLPAVSFLKAPGYEDGHAGYSDPIDEQNFVTTEINALEKSPDWSSTAVILAYDDSDGWYDHVDAGSENKGNPQNASQTADDTLTGAGQCGTATPELTNSAGEPEQGRCGYGPRQPLLVISPWAKSNYVSTTLTDQSSIVKFIEDNWRLGSIPGSAANIAGSLESMFDFNRPATDRKLVLNTATGEPVASSPGWPKGHHGSLH